MGASFLAERRGDDLFFDSGDCVRSGNLAIPLRPEVVWQHLAAAGCSASVIGNRESHPLTVGLNAKLGGAQHPVLCANLRQKGATERPLGQSIHLVNRGLRVGVFGVSVAMVTERMRTQVASNYLWDPPLEVARQMVKGLRSECDVLIALTHIGHRQDLLLAEQNPEIDIILGGHSHTVLEAPVQHGAVWVAQGGAHGHFWGEYEYYPAARKLTGGLRPFTEHNAPKR